MIHALNLSDYLEVEWHYLSSYYIYLLSNEKQCQLLSRIFLCQVVLCIIYAL